MCFLFGVNVLCFCGWVNVAFGCDCVVNGGWETMRNVATTEGKTFERNPKKLWKEILRKKGKENCFRQSFDCPLNDRKCAVYCHLGMKLARCMLDKS